MNSIFVEICIQSHPKDCKNGRQLLFIVMIGQYVNTC